MVFSIAVFSFRPDTLVVLKNNLILEGHMKIMEQI
jgi:hypothetical protein